MQYETIFDIDSALPDNWGGLLVGAAIVALFLMARFRQAQLEGLDIRQGIETVLSHFIWPKFLRPMVQLLALAIIAFAIVLTPRWRWGVGAGASIMALTLWHLVANYSAILDLRNATPVEVITGPISKIDRYVTASARREYLDIGQRHFDYGEHDPGTPYSLTSGIRSIATGQHVRLSLAGDRIIRAERQLCLLYTQCRVNYFLGVRIEFDLR